MPHGYLDPYSLRVKRWRKAIYLRTIERRNLFEAQRIIYTTPEEMHLAMGEIPALPRGFVVSLGGDPPTQHPADLASEFYASFPEARGRRQLLFLGRLHFKKGLDRILSVLPSIVQAFPEILLTVVGDGEPEFKEMIKQTIRRQSLDNNVLFTGRLDGPEKWGAYASAELFLLPSRQENFAITVAEAMHMGLPIIISNKVNTWPYVKEAHAGVILDEEGILSSLQDSLLSLLNDRSIAKLMGSRGQTYARKALTWDMAGDALLKCYDEVLSYQS